MSNSMHPVKVHVRNFQSIEDLEFEVRGFTCITGKTNIGKSAIMRALSRALLNDPVTGMVRKGAKFASVELASEGWGFLWEKGEKDVNRYSLPDGRTLDKTGQVQPKEIQEMGFRSVRIGDDDLEPWWAPQVNPMFLLNKSGPQITNFISEVSRLQVYQNAIVLAARMKRRCTDESRTKSEELGRIQDRLTRLSGLESVERLESEIEEQIESLQECIQRALTLDELHKALERVADRLRRTKAVSEIAVKANMEEVDAAVSQCVRLARTKFRLDRTAQRIIVLKAADSLKVPELPEEEVSRLRTLRRCLRLIPVRSFLERSAGVPKTKIPDMTSLEAAVSRVRKLHTESVSIVKKSAAVKRFEKLPEVPELPEEEVQKLKKMVQCVSRIQELKSAIEGADADVQRLTARRKELAKRIASMQVCPECGQKLPDSEHTHAKRKRTLSA